MIAQEIRLNASSAASSQCGTEPGVAAAPCFGPAFQGTLTVPVVFHVITADDGTTGNVPAAVIEQQVALMNAAYAGTVAFRLAGTTRTANSAWFSGFGSGDDLEVDVMMSALNIDVTERHASSTSTRLASPTSPPAATSRGSRASRRSS